MSTSTCLPLRSCRLSAADCRFFSLRFARCASAKTLLFFTSLLTLTLFADEAALLRQLASGSTGEKDAARQTLLTNATPAAVRQLGAQLVSPDTFDNACFLLEALKRPEADAALRAALSTTSGREQAGLLGALARRADIAAESQAIALLNKPEPVRTAALNYLGSIATPGALAALEAAPLDAASADAIMAAAEKLAGRKALKQAVNLYARLYRSSSLSDPIRLAAFCGLVHADTANAAALLPEGLRHASPIWRGTAARLASQLPDKVLKKKGANLMKSLQPEGRLALVNALAHAKKRAGAPLVRAAMGNEADADVRLAAISGIGTLGDAEDAPALIALLGHTDTAVADAARMSLIKLDDPDTDVRLTRALSKASGDAATLTRLLGVVTFRKSPKAAPTLLPCLTHTAPAVRAAAFNALAALCVKDTAPAIAAAAATATDPAEIRAAPARPARPVFPTAGPRLSPHRARLARGRRRVERPGRLGRGVAHARQLLENV